MQRDYIYTLCAEWFGWTPQQTDKVDAETVSSMLTFMAQIKKREAEAMKGRG